MLWLTWIIEKIKTWYYSEFAVNPTDRLRCPSCGTIPTDATRKLAYSPNHLSILSKCPVCSALWAIPTIVPPESWAVKGLDPSEKDETGANELLELVKRTPIKRA